MASIKKSKMIPVIPVNLLGNFEDLQMESEEVNRRLAEQEDSVKQAEADAAKQAEEKFLRSAAKQAKKDRENSSSSDKDPSLSGGDNFMAQLVNKLDNKPKFSQEKLLMLNKHEYSKDPAEKVQALYEFVLRRKQMDTAYDVCTSRYLYMDEYVKALTMIGLSRFMRISLEAKPQHPWHRKEINSSDHVRIEDEIFFHAWLSSLRTTQDGKMARSYEELFLLPENQQKFIKFSLSEMDGMALATTFVDLQLALKTHSTEITPDRLKCVIGDLLIKIEMEGTFEAKKARKDIMEKYDHMFASFDDFLTAWLEVTGRLIEKVDEMALFFNLSTKSLVEAVRAVKNKSVIPKPDNPKPGDKRKHGDLTGVGDKDLCHGCGKNNHLWLNCAYVKAGHPNANMNKGIPWNSSEQGKNIE